MKDASQALAAYARDDAGRLVASLTRSLGDFDLAEESVQDAIVEALRTWPDGGVPDKPGAWLRVAARRKATDRLRRSATQQRHLVELAELDVAGGAAGIDVADDRLVLLFMCCHPTLSREAQLALILRSVLGLTTAQVAKAFLITEPTMAKRIVRAKRKVTEARIPFEVPTGADAQARLQEVLTSVYVMFNEGYLSAGPEHAARTDLVDDAVWLASLLTRLLPDEPEVVGLQCLCALHRARDPARFDRQGEIVLLKDQDRSLWDRAAIEATLGALNAALRTGQHGFFLCQAAIAACHATAKSWDETDWGLIVDLYDRLCELADSPVVHLNRAIALSHRDGGEVGLAELEPLAQELDAYHLFHAARAEMLKQLGRDREALACERRALQLTANPAERRLLERRLASSGLYGE